MLTTKIDKKTLPYIKDYREQNEVLKVAQRLATLADFFEFIRAKTMEDPTNLDGFIAILKPNLHRARIDIDTLENIIHEYEIIRKPKLPKDL